MEVLLRMMCWPEAEKVIVANQPCLTLLCVAQVPIVCRGLLHWLRLVMTSPSSEEFFLPFASGNLPPHLVLLDNIGVLERCLESPSCDISDCVFEFVSVDAMRVCVVRWRPLNTGPLRTRLC